MMFHAKYDWSLLNETTQSYMLFKILYTKIHRNIMYLTLYRHVFLCCFLNEFLNNVWILQRGKKALDALLYLPEAWYTFGSIRTWVNAYISVWVLLLLKHLLHLNAVYYAANAIHLKLFIFTIKINSVGIIFKAAACLRRTSHQLVSQ